MWTRPPGLTCGVPARRQTSRWILGSGLFQYYDGSFVCAPATRDSVAKPVDRCCARQPMISPYQPTSWSMVGEPALAWSGNLWTWDPQLQYEEKLLSHHLTFGVGLIGPQAPMVYVQSQPGGPSASEQSRQPGYEARLGSVWSHGDHPMNLGVGGYYSRQHMPMVQRRRLGGHAGGISCSVMPFNSQAKRIVVGHWRPWRAHSKTM
jgi:hypothetical protein